MRAEFERPRPRGQSTLDRARAVPVHQGHLHRGGATALRGGRLVQRRASPRIAHQSRLCAARCGHLFHGQSRVPDRERAEALARPFEAGVSGWPHRCSAPPAGASPNAGRRHSRRPGGQGQSLHGRHERVGADCQVRAGRRRAAPRERGAVAPDPRRRTVGVQPGPRAQPRPGPAAVTATCNQKLVAASAGSRMQANKQREARSRQRLHASGQRSAPGKRDNRPGV